MIKFYMIQNKYYRPNNKMIIIYSILQAILFSKIIYMTDSQMIVYDL
jgi:hypothetical protein